MMTWLLAALVVLGCSYWWALTMGGLRMLSAVPDLGALDDLPAPLGRLSVVVAARDEAHALHTAAASVLASADVDLELVLVDDRSADGTAEIVDALAAEDPRVGAVHVDALPEDWLGKVHALQRGLERTRGDWVLFTDADVHFAPGALSRAVALAEQRDLDHLVVLPGLVSEGFLLDTVLATFGRLFTVGTRLWKVGDPDSSAYVGVGAFNLVRRSALEATPGLSAIRLDVVDDLALGMLLKRSGARCGVARGVGLVDVEWYRDLGEMVRGLEKSSWSVVARFRLTRLVGVSALVAWCELAPFVAPFVGPWWLRALGLATLALVLLTGWAAAHHGRRPLVPGLLAPVGGLLWAWITLRGGVLGWRRGGVLWRDTLYSNERLRAGMTCWP